MVGPSCVLYLVLVAGSVVYHDCCRSPQTCLRPSIPDIELRLSHSSEIPELVCRSWFAYRRVRVYFVRTGGTVHRARQASILSLTSAVPYSVHGTDLKPTMEVEEAGEAIEYE
jgi:hypothetical protein